MGIGALFYIKPSQGESIKTVANAGEEATAAIYGTVVSGEDKKPLSGAVAFLFRCGDAETLVCSAVTDSAGRFCFGPLEAGQTYMVRIFKNSVKVRELEIVTE